MSRSKVIHPALYRASQFFTALRAGLPAWVGGVKGGLTAADQGLVAMILPAPAQRRLFAQMSPQDQRHALAVAHTLQQAGYSHPALLQAALLHDVGKSIGQPIMYRVLIVLLKAFWPASLEWLASPPYLNLAAPESQGRWRLPFIVHAQHPAIGAAWAEAAACESLAVTLIARHQDTLAEEPVGEEEKLLAALQWADDLN